MPYVIRNCPAIYGIDDGFLCSYREDDESEKYCYDRTDCIMKQIYEMCKSQKESSCIFAVAFLADRILQLLQIEVLNET